MRPDVTSGKMLLSENLKSPAKVNLRLKILGRLPNGYHRLDMIMVPLSLADDLEVKIFEVSDGGSSEIILSSNHPDFPCDSRNTVWKALMALQKRSGKNFSARIHVTKHTPTGAGLGGGSSNAAIILKELNARLSLGLSSEVLHELAVSIGADVPFFLEEGPHRVTGIGEKLESIQLPKMYFVLMNPGVPVSTADAYGWYDEWVKGEKHELTEEKRSVSYPALNSDLDNDLERVVIPRYPVLAQMKQLLMEAGALGPDGSNRVLMSGSGSTVFALFDSPEAQVRGYEEVCRKKNPGWWVQKANSVDRFK